MAKITKAEERQQNMAEAVSKTEQFFKEYSKIIYGCVIAVLVIALCVLAYNRFIYQPKKAQAIDQMAQAERWFEAGEYELALDGDDTIHGILVVVVGNEVRSDALYLVGACTSFGYERAFGRLDADDLRLG